MLGPITIRSRTCPYDVLVLQVNLLGPIALELDGVVQPVVGDPAQKVLAWLALRPDEFFARSRIAEILWPGGSRDSTLNSFNQGLTALRATLRSLGAEEDEYVRVAPPKRSQLGLFGVITDVTQFRSLRDLDELSEALLKVRGTPLADVGVMAGYWIEQLQQNLCDEIDEVLVSLASRAATDNRHADALGYQLRRIEYAPDADDPVCEAARCYVVVGKPKNALALISQYESEHPGSSAEILETKHAIESSKQVDGHTLRQQPLTPSQFAPTHSFPGTAGFDPTFNGLVTRDLAATHTYFFRGISAKYVPARLQHRGPGLDAVRVIMIDPSANEAITLRALDRLHNPKYSGRDLEALQSSLREEILRSLVALFGCRSIATIDVALVASTAVDRVELFDDSVFVALYHGIRSRGKAFPETLRYSKTAVAYSQHRLDCLRQFDLARTRLQFRADDPDDVLPQALETLAVGLEPNRLTSLRDDARVFTASFLDELTSLTKHGAQ